MRESLELLLLCVLLQRKAETSSPGNSAKDMFAAWQQYQQDCNHKMLVDPQPTGLVCNRTFDMYACWDDALPNTTARVPCPWYLPWYQQETSVDSGAVPTDVHSGLFHFSSGCGHGPGPVVSLQAVGSCRLAQVLTQYCVCANYYWLLVEGVYLHNLLGPMAFSEESYFSGYLFVGWGSPILCWERNDNMGYWWIIRCPILLAIFVNFVIFICIIKILISKLRAQQMCYADYKMRLAKSTLTLIPLLGIHEVVFALVTEEQAQGTLRHIKFFFELFLNSLQGLLVSILYCFINKEVQSEIQRKWQRCQWGAGLLEKQGQSLSCWASWRSRSSHGKKAVFLRPCGHPGPPGLHAGLENPGGARFQPTHTGSQSYGYIPVRMKSEDNAESSSFCNQPGTVA
ncbi:hypothetical protein JD844_005919 [Phrynosoma platyrhinos]|uniref:Gastric inhibitory polypeptide receptor n=1 Tax=Phrynosoma platyrhinos TaxID=52577 RepID=A0ABQ7TPM8_PHRPL|nr:hypothetical protein JD844_005919 [Phrynosoma platyrhinos]